MKTRFWPILVVTTPPSGSTSDRGARWNRLRNAGFTFVELLVAMSIGLMVVAGMLTLVLELAKEQRRGTEDLALVQSADLLRDRMQRLIRAMSSTESVNFGDSTYAGSPFYRRVVMARGLTPAFPREEIYYDPVTQILTHDPNRAQPGPVITLFRNTELVKLREFYFYPSMKPGEIPDSSALNIWIEMDDDGLAGRKNPDGSPRRTTVVRTATVKMRN